MLAFHIAEINQEQDFLLSHVSKHLCICNFCGVYKEEDLGGNNMKVKTATYSINSMDESDSTDHIRFRFETSAKNNYISYTFIIAALTCNQEK